MVSVCWLGVGRTLHSVQRVVADRSTFMAVGGRFVVADRSTFMVGGRRVVVANERPFFQHLFRSICVRVCYARVCYARVYVSAVTGYSRTLLRTPTCLRGPVYI